MSMNLRTAISPRLVGIFALACLVPLAFALYTQHAWEDYYITFRASRNLATGHGLVFNIGDRLQTFTSPIGVLLPALASALTGNSSDAGALWIFRALCIGAFGVTATVLFATATHLRYSAIAAAALVGWLITDAKSVDFTINGMETAFLLLGFAATFWAMFGNSSRPALHLGLAWGALMWTRPDSFIYIGLFATAVLLFNQQPKTGRSRVEWLRLFLYAGVVAAIVYLPWFLFAWSYYGSPVPHTIVAKGTAAGPKTLSGFWYFLGNIRHWAWSPRGTFELLFMPTYVIYDGWPVGVRFVGRILAMVCSIAWIVPGVRTETKASSFALLGSHLYLSYFPPFVFPWYLCLPTLLGFVTLAGLLSQGSSTLRALRFPGAAVLAVVISVTLILPTLAVNGWLTLQSARQLKAQEELIEIGNRREIGLWLRAHAAPGDTVMLEPLGYIGYYSGLKTYDIPGLSSREVVNVIRRVGYSWGSLVAELKPDWIVLRPHEIAAIGQTQPQLLAQNYVRMREFNVRDKVSQLDVHGRDYLAFDSQFTVFRKRH